MLRLIGIAVVGVMGGASALAQSAAPAPDAGWIATIKGNIGASPDYPGADDYGFMGYPSIAFSRSGAPRRFSAPDDGLSIGFDVAPNLRVGPVARYQGGRYDGDNRELTGLRDVPWAVEPGVFAEFWPLQDRLRTRLEIRHGVGGHHGVIGTLGADLVDRFGAWTVSAGPRVQIADGDYMDTYFGVSEQEAAANSSVSAFRADGGLKSYGLAASATYRFNPVWETTVYAGYDRLTQDAENSPIVKAFGSADQFRIGASMSYSFTVPGF